MKEVAERGTRIKIESSDYNLAGFDHFKSEVLADIRTVKYRDLEDMVYRMKLTYDEIVDLLDLKCCSGSIVGYALQPGLYDISDNLMLESLVLNDVKVKNIIDDNRI